MNLALFRGAICALISCCIMSAAFAEDLSFRADRVRSVFAEGSEQTVLEGSARVDGESLQISANSISIYGEDNRYIDSSGNVYLNELDSGIMLEAQFMSYDSQDEHLVLEGSVSFLDQGEDISVSSDYLERQGELSVFQIDVQIVREDMVARAEYLRYFEDSGVLELSGFPLVYYQGDEYSAQVIRINTDTNEIILQGEVQGQIGDREEEGDETDEAGAEVPNSEASRAENSPTTGPRPFSSGDEE